MREGRRERQFRKFECRREERRPVARVRQKIKASFLRREKHPKLEKDPKE